MPKLSKQEREINGLITTTESLAEDVRSILRGLHKHDPRQEDKERPSLPALMSDIGHVARWAVELRDEIRKVYERRQRDGI